MLRLDVIKSSTLLNLTLLLRDLLVLYVIVWFAECGGKMHLREGEYEKAHTDFFEAFKNYDESGSPRYISVKRLVKIFIVV